MDIEDTLKSILAVNLAVVVPFMGLLVAIEISGVNPFAGLATG